MGRVFAGVLGLALISLVVCKESLDVKQEEDLANLIHQLSHDVDGLKSSVESVLSKRDEVKKDEVKKDEKKEEVKKDDKKVEEEDFGSPEDDLRNDPAFDDPDVGNIANINLKANTEEAAKKLGETLEGGDEMLDKEQEENWNYDAKHQNDGTAKDALRNINQLWPKTGARVKIPIFLTTAITGNPQKMKAIKDAVDEYSKLTCIDFERRATQPTNEHYIRFISDRGCYSLLGKSRSRNGYQPISIGNGCGYKGIVEHEFMHALGFFHEQSRPDRDQYIKIQLQNLVNAGLASQFRMVPETALNAGTYKVPYDIGSIMHYGSTAFAKRGTFTIVRKSDNRPFRSNRAGFAQSDLTSLRLLYRCGGAPPPVTPAPPTPGPPRPGPGPKPSPRRCFGWAKLGLCDYREICAMCSQLCKSTAAASIPKMIVDLRSERKCTYWLRTGYCSSRKQGNKAMMKLCPKTCFRAAYPADGTCR